MANEGVVRALEVSTSFPGRYLGDVDLCKKDRRREGKTLVVLKTKEDGKP